MLRSTDDWKAARARVALQPADEVAGLLRRIDFAVSRVDVVSMHSPPGSRVFAFAAAVQAWESVRKRAEEAVKAMPGVQSAMSIRRRIRASRRVSPGARRIGQG